MILVFGGTTEGRKTATLLEGMGLPFIYSTKTKIDFSETENSRYRYGILEGKELSEYLEKENIKLIINAAHPFAKILHENIARVAEIRKIPVLRFGRKILPRQEHHLVSYVDSYEEAISLFDPQKKLWALTGVQSIILLKSWWLKQPTFFRILDRPESLAMAKGFGFPESQLILGLTSNKVTEEISLVKKHQIGMLLTKETGNSGFLNTKIQVALQMNIPIIIIKSPEISDTFEQVFSTETLKTHLENSSYCFTNKLNR